MSDAVTRLLCIDLQVDPAFGLDPDPRSIFGARQLLAMGRNLDWEIAHTRRRPTSMSVAASAAAAAAETGIAGVRPLPTERVYLRHGRAITDSPGLVSLLDAWAEETVYVASFDNVALLSALLACYDRGPHLVLVEDALSAHSPYAGRPSLEAFRTVQGNLACGATSIGRILSGAHAPPHLPAATA